MPTVLITGSNRGIGLEFTKQFSQLGWKCIACCRNKVNSEELKNLSNKFSQNIFIEEMDILNHLSIDLLAKKYTNQPIDMIINNAGILGPRTSDISSQSFGTMDYDFWDKVHKTNTIGPFKVVEAFFESLEISSKKIIVVISSTVGSNVEMYAPVFSYASSKAAANKIFTLLSNLLTDKGYKIQIFCPGNVKTDMGGKHANVDVRDSVRGMINQLMSLSHDHSGVFKRFNGEKIEF